MKYVILKVIRNLLGVVLFINIFVLFPSCENFQDNENYTQYVNTFIGTQNDGHCFPGATAPLGMVQPSPESYCSDYNDTEAFHVTGYQYNDPWIWGFTQTHLNGVGCPSMSDILLMPFCDREIDPSSRSNFRSSFDKKNEEADPGYYKVYLDDHNVNVELTATEHVAYHRYSFDEPNSAKLLIDLQYGVTWDATAIHQNIIKATQKFQDDYTLSGYRKAREWTERDLYYVIKFNKKINSVDELNAPENKEEKAPRYLLQFEMAKSNKLEVMIGVSTVGIEEAKANLEAEIQDWETFDVIREQTNEKWNDILGKIEIDGDKEKKTAFYTSIYHLYIQPNNIADIDGKYRGRDNEIHEAAGGKFFSTLSLWDTYRAAHPMYTILSPNLVSDVLTSMMDSYTYMPTNPDNPREANKYLPRWQLWGNETHTMVGNHAVPVFVDAWLKGIKSQHYDDEEVFEAIWSSVTKPHYRNHVELIDSFGYIPYDVKLSRIDDGRETVSRLLEGIYDDYCASLMAKDLGKKEEYDILNNRSSFYNNVYHAESGFMRGRNAKGEFKKDVDPSDVVGEWLPESDFTEGNAYHYQFHVQHDILGLMELMGGKEAFTQKLDSIFYSTTTPEVKSLVWKIHGLIGQYWHGNEPCHHVPYLYKYTNQPWKTDELIRKVVDEFYYNKPDGLAGNDDCGQMSAWYMFASLGFYPVNPCGGEYIFGAPQVKQAVINLPENKKFKITAKNLTEENLIVQSVRLNEEILDRNYITHEEIVNGGELVFVMGPKTKITN